MARDRPTDIRPPKPCFSAKRRNTNAQMAKKIRIGTTQDMRSRRKVSSATPVNCTPDFASSWATAGSTRVVTNWVLPSCGSLNEPRTNWSLTWMSSTLPSWTKLKNCE